MTALRRPGDERVSQIEDICDLIDTALESTVCGQSHGARSTVAFLKICGTLLAPPARERHMGCHGLLWMTRRDAP